LRREIVATQLANEMVNLSGSTFGYRVTSETAASMADIVRAHAASRAVFDVDSMWRDLEALDDVVGSATQTAMLLGVRQLLDRATRWFLANRRPPLDVDQTVRLFGAGVSEALARLKDDVRSRDSSTFDANVASLLALGVPAALASRVVLLPDASSCLAIVDIALRLQRPVAVAADVHFAIGDRLGLSRLAQLIGALPRDSRWHTLARAAARDDLQAAHSELTSDVLAATSDGDRVSDRVQSWLETNASAVARAGAIVSDILDGETSDLATLSVALREIRALVRAASLPGQ
jgi:glutamate dehydrogenase